MSRLLLACLIGLPILSGGQTPSRAWWNAGLPGQPLQYQFSMAVSPDQSTISYATLSPAMLINAVDGTLRRVVFAEHVTPINNLEYLALVDLRVRLARTVDGTVTHTFDRYGQPFFANGKVYILNAGKLHEYRNIAGTWVEDWNWNVPSHDFLTFDPLGRWFALATRNSSVKIYSLTARSAVPETTLAIPDLESPFIFSPNGARFAYRTQDGLDGSLSAQIGAPGDTWSTTQTLPLGTLGVRANSELFRWDPGSQAIWSVNQVGDFHHARRIGLNGTVTDWPAGIGRVGSGTFTDGIPTKTGRLFGLIDGGPGVGSFDQNGVPAFRLWGIRSIVQGAATTIDDRATFLLGSAGELIAYDSATGKYLMHLDLAESVRGVATAPGKVVVIGDTKQWWFRADNLAALKEIPFGGTTLSTAPATAQNPSLLAVGSGTNVRISRTTDYATIRQLTMPHAVSRVQFSGDGQRLAVLLRNQGVFHLTVYLTSNWSIERQWQLNAQEVHGMAINRLGNRIAITDNRIGLEAIQVFTREAQWNEAPTTIGLPTVNQGYRCLAFSPDGRTMAAGSLRGIRLYRMADLKLMASYDREAGASGFMHFTPYSQTLVHAGGDEAQTYSNRMLGALFNPLRVPAAWSLQPLQPTMKPGQKAKVVFRLSGVALANGAKAKLTVTPAGALTAPAELFVPKGQSQIQFEVTANAVANPTEVKLYAVFTRGATATIRVAP